MSASRRTIEEALKYVDKYVVIIEVPPGIGKTYTAVNKAVELASQGQIVIYVLPNHTALATAFAYAINKIYAMHGSRKRIPYLIYYEGTEKYCPFLGKDGDRLLDSAINYLVKKRKLSKYLVDEVKGMGVKDIIRVFGMQYLCKNFCPVYATRLNFKTERIFVPANINRLSNLPALLPSQRTYVSEALAKLGKMRNLVAWVNPTITPSGEPMGTCLRAIINKPLSSKRTAQIAMRGGLILAPVQALNYLLRTLSVKVAALRAAGLNPPRITVFVDEYDYYLYAPLKQQVFSVKHLEKELETAKEVAKQELMKLIQGSKDYNQDLFIAASAATYILTQIKKIVDNYLAGARNAPDIEHAFSPANIFAEALAESVRGKGFVVPPMAPRKVLFSTVQNVLIATIDALKNLVNQLLDAKGVYAFDPANVSSVHQLLSYLTLWEAEFVKRVESVDAPVLYRAYGNVLDIGYVKAPPTSIARRLASLSLSVGDTVAVVRIEPIKGEIYTRKSRSVVGRIGFRIYLTIYDTVFYTLLSGVHRVVLLSATGLPWFTPFLTVRSGGKGRKVWGTEFVAVDSIVSAPRRQRYRAGKTPEFRYLVIESFYGAKPLLIITLPEKAHQDYVSLARIIPERTLPLLPRPGTKNYSQALMESVAQYSAYVAKLKSVILKYHDTVIKDRKLVPSVLILTQRKDAALAYAALALSKKMRVEICEAQSCHRVTVKSGETYASAIARAFRRVPAPAYIMIRGKRERGVREYVTWLRSRATRGIDFHENSVIYAVVLVGTPYRPPTSFDIIPAMNMRMDAITQATIVSIPVYIKRQEVWRLAVIVHHPIDAAEAVNELVQAVGRATRRAWRLLGKGKAVRVAIIIPAYTINKVLRYAPLWFRSIST